MRLAVRGEFQSADNDAEVAVVQCSLGSVAVGQDDQTIAADRRLGGKFIELVVVQSAGGIVLEPTVEDARAVDAEQHGVVGVLGGCS